MESRRLARIALLVALCLSLPLQAAQFIVTVAPAAVVTITDPTTSPTYLGTSSNVITTIAGTATAQAAITGCTWVNRSNGASGAATGTTSWSIPSVLLAVGTNTIAVTCLTLLGGQGTAVLVVTRLAPAVPTVTITTPTSATTYDAGTATGVALAGTASTLDTITGCTWVNSLSGGGAATGTTSWSIASVPLSVGSNVITVTCTDSLSQTGNDVITVTRSASVGGATPIAASRLPCGSTAIPNPCWAQAGVVGGIPSASWAQCVNVQCQAVTNAGNTATSAQINAALQNAPTNTYVKLEAGTYNNASFTSIDFGHHSNVVLRGAGANQTKLVPGDNTSCLGQNGIICLQGGNDFSWYGPNVPAHTATWNAPYTQGLTVLSLSSVTGLTVGMPIVIDQLDDTLTGDVGDPLTCGGTPCTEQGSTHNGRAGRAQRQWLTVTAINGTNVTVSPGVSAPTYRASKSPGAWWGNDNLIENAGVEDLMIDGSNIPCCGNPRAPIALVYARNVWIKDVRFEKCPMPKHCVDVYGTHHFTIRDSIFHGSTDFSLGQTTYGIDYSGTADGLVENNIFFHRTSPNVRNGDQGSVFAYNFYFDDYYNPTNACDHPCHFMQAGQYTHETGNLMGLDEGNEGVGIKNDIIHGTANLMTSFRNYSHGWDTYPDLGAAGKTSETGAIVVYSRNRYMNLVGNVLGEPGYHTLYEATGNLAIYRFGLSYNAVPFDAFVAPSILRWGNYDTVTGTSRFVASESPSTIPTLPNPVPGNQSLPVSYYRSSKPTFMLASDPWPGIGPDVTCLLNCLPNLGSHVTKNRARLCYESLPDDLNYALDESGRRPKQAVQTAACPWFLP